MSTILNEAAAVNPARLTACPRCEGRGTVTFTRPGGWLKENDTGLPRSPVTTL